MNDSVEIQSPPSKKFKQAEIAIETNSDNKDIEKENKPIDEDSPSVDDGSFIRSIQLNIMALADQLLNFLLVEVEEKKAPQTPKSNSRPSTATPKSTTGKKRSREEIEANKLERERKYVHQFVPGLKNFIKFQEKRKGRKRGTTKTRLGSDIARTRTQKETKRGRKTKSKLRT